MDGGAVDAVGVGLLDERGGQVAGVGVVGVVLDVGAAGVAVGESDGVDGWCCWCGLGEDGGGGEGGEGLRAAGCDGDCLVGEGAGGEEDAG